jgi:hypothetical protein
MKHSSSSTTFDIILSPKGDDVMDDDDVSQSDVSDTEGDAYYANRKANGGGSVISSSIRSPGSKKKREGGREWHLRCDTFSEFQYWVPLFTSLTSSTNTTDTLAKPGERLFR